MRAKEVLVINSPNSAMNPKMMENEREDLECDHGGDPFVGSSDRVIEKSRLLLRAAGGTRATPSP